MYHTLSFYSSSLLEGYIINKFFYTFAKSFFSESEIVMLSIFTSLTISLYTCFACLCTFYTCSWSFFFFYTLFSDPIVWLILLLLTLNIFICDEIEKNFCHSIYFVFFDHVLTYTMIYLYHTNSIYYLALILEGFGLFKSRGFL